MLAFIGGIGTSEIIVLLVVGLIFAGIPLILTIWALIDAVKSDFKDSNNKLIWVLVIILVPLIGAILYLVIGRSQKVKTLEI